MGADRSIGSMDYSTNFSERIILDYERWTIPIAADCLDCSRYTEYLVDIFTRHNSALDALKIKIVIEFQSNGQNQYILLKLLYYFQPKARWKVGGSLFPPCTA